MLGLQEARSVRRSELLDSASPSPTSEDDEQLQDLLRSRFQAIYEGDINPGPESDKSEDVTLNGDVEATEIQGEEEAFEFRLFASSTSKQDAAGQATQRIVVRSPTPQAPGTGAFIEPDRPKSYYFSGPLSHAQRTEYGAIAVTGQDVTGWSKREWAGCRLPWRVVTLTAPESAVGKDKEFVAESTESREIESRKKGKPGKKRRVILRQKAREARAKEEQAAKRKTSEVDKEEHIRRKKAEKNRKQTLKRREKKRQLRAAQGRETEISQTDSEG